MRILPKILNICFDEEESFLVITVGTLTFSWTFLAIPVTCAVASVAVWSLAFAYLCGWGVIGGYNPEAEFSCLLLSLSLVLVLFGLWIGGRNWLDITLVWLWIGWLTYVVMFRLVNKNVKETPVAVDFINFMNLRLLPGADTVLIHFVQLLFVQKYFFKLYNGQLNKLINC